MGLCSESQQKTSHIQLAHFSANELCNETHTSMNLMHKECAETVIPFYSIFSVQVPSRLFRIENGDMIEVV